MITSRRNLLCGCDRVDTCDSDEERSDEQAHLEMEKVMLRNVREHTELAGTTATALTWFYRHDDVRGIEAVRALPPAKLVELVRGLRKERQEPRFGVDPAAIDTLLRALGLAIDAPWLEP